MALNESVLSKSKFSFVILYDEKYLRTWNLELFVKHFWFQWKRQVYFVCNGSILSWEINKTFENKVHLSLAQFTKS